MHSMVRCAVGALLLYATGCIVEAAERDRQEVFDISISDDDVSYYQRSGPIIQDITSGDLRSAERGLLDLGELAPPQALVRSDVHQLIGIAFGESGHFEAGIAQLAIAFDGEHPLPPGFLAEGRAYLVYFYTASARFEQARESFALLETKPAWLFAKLATAYTHIGDYACAVANAGRALQAADAGGDVASRWDERRARGPIDPGVVLEDWASRLEALRRRFRGGRGETATRPAGIPARTRCLH